MKKAKKSRRDNFEIHVLGKENAFRRKEGLGGSKCVGHRIAVRIRERRKSWGKGFLRTSRRQWNEDEQRGQG